MLLTLARPGRTTVFAGAAFLAGAFGATAFDVAFFGAAAFFTVTFFAGTFLAASFFAAGFFAATFFAGAFFFAAAFTGFFDTGFRDVFAVEGDGAATHGEEAGDRAERGGFADAVAAHEGDDFAGVYLEIDAAENARSAYIGLDGGELEEGAHSE